MQVAQVQKLRQHLFFDKNGNKLGKITSDDVDGAYAVVGKDLGGVKTGYGELEGFFGNGFAVGVYYNCFNGQKDFYADDLCGAYASVYFGSKWNALANYETLALTTMLKISTMMITPTFGSAN